MVIIMKYKVQFHDETSIESKKNTEIKYADQGVCLQSGKEYFFIPYGSIRYICVVS